MGPAHRGPFAATTLFTCATTCGLSLLDSGWLDRRTRFGGHYATLYPILDISWIASGRPSAGTSNASPGRGGSVPRPDRIVFGLRGILSIITAAWVRATEHKPCPALCLVRFTTFFDGADASFGHHPGRSIPPTALLLEAPKSLARQIRETARVRCWCWP